MSQSRQAPDKPAAAKPRLSIKDVIAVLILLGWTAAGIVAMVQEVAAYRAQQAATADFAARHQIALDQPSAGPAVPVKLIGEIAGSIVGFVLLASGLRYWRRNTIRISVKFVSAPRRRVNPAGATATRFEPLRNTKPAVIAAERLSLVVWADHLAHLEKEHA